MIDCSNINSNNLQMILRQQFEKIKYGNSNDVLPAQQIIDELYDYFVTKGVISQKEFRNHLLCAQVAARR